MKSFRSRVLHISRRILVVFFAIGLISCQQTPEKQTQSKPNVVVFVVDDMGLMDTSVPFLTNQQNVATKYPLNHWYRTPSMERLAANGTRFGQFYAQSVCSPTRASLLTGQNAARHKTTTWIKPDENNRGTFGPKHWNWQGLTSNNLTLAKTFQQNGYKTIHIGKGHFGPLGSEGEDPVNLGFDNNVAGAAWGRPKNYFGQDHYGNHQKYKKGRKPLTHNIPHLEAYHGSDTFLTEALTIEAKKQLQLATSEDSPFFLYMSHYAVHAPFNSDPRFAQHYQSSDKSKKAQAYATLVEGMDKSLGDLVAHLEQLGEAENTLILFMGDNGGDAPLGGNDVIASSAPLKGKKGTSWEGGMRAPLIIAWAKPDANNKLQQRWPIAQGAINEQIATVMDIYPTLLSAANLAVPSGSRVDGFNLSEQLQQQYNQDRENTFLMHFPHKHRHSYFTVYRQQNWKLIYHYNPENKPNIKRYQLFDLARDPAEQTDLAEQEPKVLYKMVATMKTKLLQQGALYPQDKNGQALHPILPKFTRSSK